MLASAKRRAKTQGEDFRITVEDIIAVWPEDDRCPALGLAMSPGEKDHHDASPSLDRMNNAWGYLPGNIAVISYAANRTKGKMRAQELERIAAWMRSVGLD